MHKLQKKGQRTVPIFVKYLSDHLITHNNKKDIEEIIWTDGPSSEFKIRFTVTCWVFYF